MSGYVCDDLLVQIFERLPPKSIIRFRSLSKYWHSRLLSPEFLHLHRLRCSKNPPKVIIRHIIIGGEKHMYRGIYTLHSGDKLPLDLDSGFVGVPGVEIPYYLYPLMGSVIGSCNGIMCLHNNTNITLWNFSVRRKLIVPRHPTLKLGCYSTRLGFGFDPIANDYNIVAITNNNSAYMYSLKTDSWSSAIPSPSIPLLYSTYVTRKACFFNGILHWLVHGYSTTQERTCNYILTFNLSSRVFGYILLPKSWKAEHVTTINGCLALVHPEYHKFYKDDNSWIKVMKEYGNIESLSPLFKVKREPYRRMTVFQPIINGDILAYFHVEGSKVDYYKYKQTNVTNRLEFRTDWCKLEMDDDRRLSQSKT